MEYNPYELLYMSHFDERAQMALFQQYTPLIRGVVSNCVSKYPPLADYRDDLFQVGEIALFTAADTYRNDQNASFLTYLTLVVRRRIWSECRKVYHQTTYNGDSFIRLDSTVCEQEPRYGTIPQTDPFCDPEYYAGFAGALERLQEVYRNMNEEEVQLVQSWISREKYTDAAERMNMSVRSYESRLYRVRRKVRKAVYDDA